jgi:hypothetical protein
MLRELSLTIAPREQTAALSTTPHPKLNIG